MHETAVMLTPFEHFLRACKRPVEKSLLLATAEIVNFTKVTLQSSRRAEPNFYINKNNLFWQFEWTLMKELLWKFHKADQMTVRLLFVGQILYLCPDCDFSFPEEFYLLSWTQRNTIVCIFSWVLWNISLFIYLILLSVHLFPILSVIKETTFGHSGQLVQHVPH